MLVNNLLIEAFRRIDEETVCGLAALCEFDQARWLGVRRTDTESRLGPASIVEPETRYTKTSFPERLLAVEAARRPFFSYTEPWTVPPWTLNVLAPPQGFVAQALNAELLDGSGQIRFRAAHDDGRLFYFALFRGNGDRIGFETKARFAHDPAAADREAARADRVASSNWKNLWAAAAAPLSAASEVVSTAAAIKTLLG
jgi:hypothetical protein